MNEELELLKEKILQANQEMVDLVSSTTEEDDFSSIRKKFDILDLRLKGFQREFSVLRTLRDIESIKTPEEVLTE